jgi:hypothetical protein
MTSAPDQRAAWKRALAAHAKARRNQRGKRPRKPAIKPGMIRRPPQNDVPASQAGQPKETPA